MTPNVVSNLGGPVDLLVAQATDYGPCTLTFINPDGTPVDLTGVTLAADIRKQQGSEPTYPITVTVNEPPTAGLATLSIPYSVTSTLTAGANLADPAGWYIWDLKYTSAGGLVSRPLFGKVTVYREVTP